MKNIRKIISFILAVLTIVSTVSVGSFAATERNSSPIKSLKFEDNCPISNKAVQSAAATSGDKVYLNSLMENPYAYKPVGIHKNGETSTPVYFSMYVKASECATAISKGKKTVSVYVSADFANEDKIITDSFVDVVLEKKIVKEIVKNITIIGSVPDYAKEGIYDAFYGKKFEIEYADGRKEIGKVGYNDYNFTLADYPIYFDDGEYSEINPSTGDTVFYTGLKISYLDSQRVHNIKYIPCPYESIEIADLIFENGKLSKISYTLTYSDGKKANRTCLTDGIHDTSFFGSVIDVVNGYDVTVSVFTSHSDYSTDAKGYLYIDIGYDIWEIDDYKEFRMADYCNCICHKSGLQYIIYSFILKIWNIFGIKNYCNCGDWHW